MDAFSYLSVLISIVLGLGITQLLTGLGRLLQSRAGTRVYPPAVIWVGVLLLVHVQSWWAMFGLRGVGEWTFAMFLMVLVQPSVLYLMAALTLPEPAVGPQGDMRATYFAHARPFFVLAVLLLAVSVTKDLVVDRRLPAPLNLGTHALLATLWGAAAATRSDRYHRVLAPLTAAIFSAYVVTLFARLR